MKNVFLSLWLGLLASVSFAQIQYGQVREINSGKSPVANVQVVFTDAVPTVSGTDGQFKLRFEGKKPGDMAFYEEISKPGYELVNDRDLEIIILTNSNELPKDIILAKKGYLEAAKKVYYEVSDQALQVNFQKEKQKLRQQLAAAELEQQQYLEQVTALREAFDRQQKTLDELARQFAQINFDDVGPLYQEALNLFKSGQIDSCKMLLAGADLMSRAEKQLAERNRIEEARKKIRQQEAENERGIVESIKLIRLQAKTHVLSFEFAQAEKLYDQLLLLDSTNLEVLRESAAFYAEQHRYAKAKRCYRLLIGHPQITQYGKWQSLDALSAIHLRRTGSLDTAIQLLEQADQLMQRLLAQADTSAILQNSYCQTLDKLGEAQMALGNLQKAKPHFLRCNLLAVQLNARKTGHLPFMSTLATSHEQLGRYFRERGQSHQAQKHFTAFANFQQHIIEIDSSNSYYKNKMGIAYQLLGEIYTDIGKLNEALMFYNKYHLIEKSLHESFPQNVEFKHGWTISCGKVADTYLSLGQLEEALTYYQKLEDGFTQLLDDYPTNVGFQYGLAVAYSYLGYAYSFKGKQAKALAYYEKQAALFAQLKERFPENSGYANGLAVAHQFLGLSYMEMGDLPKALAHFQQFNQLEKDISAKDPENAYIKNLLSISHRYLGETHQAMEAWAEAEAHFEQAIALSMALHQSDPLNVDYQKSLALGYEFMGLLHRAKASHKRALTYFKKDFELSEQLYALDTTNLLAKNGLAVAYQLMGTTHLSLGRADLAEDHLQQYLALMEQLQQADPSNVVYRENLAIAYASMGSFYQEQDQTAKAKSYFQQAQRIFQQLIADAPDQVKFQEGLEEVMALLEELEQK